VEKLENPEQQKTKTLILSLNALPNDNTFSTTHLTIDRFSYHIIETILFFNLLLDITKWQNIFPYQTCLMASHI
jgi:hypothetical protein